MNVAKFFNFSSSLILVLIGFCSLFINLRCSSKKNIYETLPLGSKLSSKILSKSSQIIPNQSSLILVYNCSENWEYVNNHVLFFDRQMKLYGACYMPSNQIDSIRTNVLYAALDKIKKERENQFSCDLPKEYRVSLKQKVQGWSRRKSDKVVNKISLSPTNKSGILINVMKSLDQYQGLKQARDTSYISYIIPDTLRLDISEVLIQYNLKRIIVHTLDSNGNTISDILIVRNYGVLDEFYKAILEKYYFE